MARSPALVNKQIRQILVLEEQANFSLGGMLLLDEIVPKPA